MTGMIDYFEEKKPKIKKSKKKKKKILKWHDWVLAVVLSAVIITPIVLLANANAGLQNQKNEALAEQKQWRDAAHRWMNTANNIAGKNLELKKQIEKLNSFANAAHMEAKKARFITGDWKNWGKDMETLAQKHAGTFQKLRIENDKLSGELNLEKTKAESLKQSLARLNEQLNTYKDIIEKQKAEILRLQEAYKSLRENIKRN